MEHVQVMILFRVKQTIKQGVLGHDNFVIERLLLLGKENNENENNYKLKERCEGELIIRLLRKRELWCSKMHTTHTYGPAVFKDQFCEEELQKSNPHDNYSAPLF